MRKGRSTVSVIQKEENPDLIYIDLTLDGVRVSMVSAGKGITRGHMVRGMPHLKPNPRKKLM